jgi:hypothetical protein
VELKGFSKEEETGEFSSNDPYKTEIIAEVKGDMFWL